MRTSAIVLMALLAGALFACDNPRIVSVSSDGEQGNASSDVASISADGRFVAFRSGATNLVPDDTNGPPGAFEGLDIFVHDRETGTTERVSVASDGTQANDRSDVPFLSADGRFVVFCSQASNLVPDDTNGVDDVFVHDRETGDTTRVSVGGAGEEGDGPSFPGNLTADGRFIVFSSLASTLTPGDTNGALDVFVRDLLNGAVERVSVAVAGGDGNEFSRSGRLSAEGRFVAFESRADNLVAGDTNGHQDVFVHDRLTDTTELVSVATDGAQGNADSFSPSLSADGRFIAFSTDASTLAPDDTNGRLDAFVRDRLTGVTTRVSIASDGTQGNRDSFAGGITADGRWVAFTSDADNLVPGDTNLPPFSSPQIGRDYFLHDRAMGKTSRVSLGQFGEQGNNSSSGGGITPNGTFVVFSSAASNFHPLDTNGRGDVFVRRLLLPSD